ncbi:MAG: hypothetical protein IPI22_04340 [Bacteroidetes bacterium]|nr:hypothetical protein [Bacteroidota bacterium]
MVVNFAESALELDNVYTGFNGPPNMPDYNLGASGVGLAVVAPGLPKERAGQLEVSKSWLQVTLYQNWNVKKKRIV